MPSSRGKAPRGARAARPRRPVELSPRDLRWTCPPSSRALSTPRARSVIGTIGQERAIRALRLGIQLYAPGYNVFVCGITGTGRASTVKKILDRIKNNCPLPPDRCYVHNFSRPDEPRLLTLPRGLGPKLLTEMRRFVRDIRRAVPAILESDAHGRKRERIVSRYEGEGDRLIERLEQRAGKEGFALKRVRDEGVSRPELFPILQGQATALADVERLVVEGKLSPGRAQAIVRQYQQLHQTLENTARRSRELIARMEMELAELERREVRARVKERADAVLEAFPQATRETLAPWLDDVVEDIVSHRDLFRQKERPAPAAPDAGSGEPETGRPALHGVLDRLRVNLIFDARRHPECPVIVETHPTYRRLFGYFERTLHASGHWSTDFTRIRAGSLLAADGGYLVVTAEDVFSPREIWMELKRCLMSRSLSILDEMAGTGMPSVSLRPEPIPVNVKVILIGQREIYELLIDNEPDFHKMFKVLADFDEEMDLNVDTLRQYAAFVRQLCAEEGLAPLEPSAMAAVAEQGARYAGRQDKLTARFGEIADVLREADYWRRQEPAARRVAARHVRLAIQESLDRSSQIEQKLQDMIRRGQILVQLRGRRVGQINGLVVHETGDHVFGLPARITATVSPGTAGIINIEREALMSGRTHTKGVLIIGGFLRETFGHDRPVTLTASIAFEQSYGGVEGDSASASEVLALLSALAGEPVRQGVAVTGSVDQKGVIQPVGGINEKIEGFFKVCEARGLTGDQGVIVPHANRLDLMLSHEVIEAVRRRRFHVFPVRQVGEALEILTGRRAGLPRAAGGFPAGTLMRRVEERLSRFNERIRRFGPSLPG